MTTTGGINSSVSGYDPASLAAKIAKFKFAKPSD